MKCPNCGKEVNENSKFCTECGGALVQKNIEAGESNGENEMLEQNNQNYSTLPPRKKLSRGWKITISVICAVVVLAIIGTVFSDESIDIVKNGKSDVYNSKTCGEAFESFFDDAEWDCESINDKYDRVIFTGRCQYMEEDVEAVIEFRVNTEEEKFYIDSLTLDGEPQTDLILAALLEKIYE